MWKIFLGFVGVEVTASIKAVRLYLCASVTWKFSETKILQIRRGYNIIVTLNINYVLGYKVWKQKSYKQIFIAVSCSYSYSPRLTFW